MKNLPGNPCRGGFAGFAGAGIGLMGLLTMPAIAQQYPSTASGNAQQPAQQGPVDLLAAIQDNGSAGGNGGIVFSLDNSSALQGLTPPEPAIDSIDEAIDSVTRLPVQMAPAASEPTSAAELVEQAETMPAATVAETQTTEESPTDSVTLTETADGTTAASRPITQGVTETSALAETSSAPSVKLQRRAAPDFGVAAIGVESGHELNATIWRDTPAERAAMLLDNDIVKGSSPSLSALAHDVVAQRAVPPVGGEMISDALVTARLEWLAAAGRSQTLERIVNQLPNDPPWLGWKQWLVETQLMSRRDEDACRTVTYQVSRTFEPFWHKAKVICSAAMGDMAGAQFAADILTAMGVNDPVFSALVTQLLTDAGPGPIDPSLLEPLHIVLMDAAHDAVGMDGLAALSDGSIETAVALRYLDADARLVSTWRALDRGLVDHGKAAKLWRSAKFAPDVAAMALARHQSQPSPLTRALMWRALDHEKSVARLPLIAKAMDADIASGAGLMMAPLYAELSREGLGFDGAADVLAADTALAARMAMLIGVGDDGAIPSPLDNDRSNAVRDLLLGVSNGDADLRHLGALDLWHLLPLLASDNMDVTEASWLDLAMPVAAPATYLSASPLILRALEEAAADRRVAETVLLAHRIVGDLDLAAIHPADVARIGAALRQVGQPAAASAFAGEVVTAHILSQMALAGDVREIVAPPAVETDRVPSADEGVVQATVQEAGSAVEDSVASTDAGMDAAAAGTTELSGEGELAGEEAGANTADGLAVSGVDGTSPTTGTNADTSN